MSNINKEKQESLINLINQLEELKKSDINKNLINQIKCKLNQIFMCVLKQKITNYANIYSNLQKLLDILYDFIVKHNKNINFCILEEVYFLFSNLKSEEILNYLYSTKFNINKDGLKLNIFEILILINFDAKEEQCINTQANLMKSLLLKINDTNISNFYDNEINSFPLLNRSLFLYDNQEDMVRNIVKNNLLLITKINNNSLRCYLTSFPIALYYPNIIYKFKDVISQLSYAESKNDNIYTYLEEKHEEIYDTILYLNDILLCEIKNINFVLINCLLNEIIFPLLNIIISNTNSKISIFHSIYLLSLFIFYLKNEFIVDLISFFLFQEQIPSNLLEKIKECKYKDNGVQFISDINSLIKNIDADINDKEWKRNADFIKKDIGIDLYTGIVEKDNIFHYFNDYLSNIKNKRLNYIQNDIFKNLNKLLASKDDNKFLSVVILLFNEIYYYFNYFKNYNDNKDDEIGNETFGKNSIRNTEIVNNNLKKLNRINNNKIKLKNDINFDIFNDKTKFNPFLLHFFNISNSNINNSINLFEILVDLYKKNNKIFCIDANIIVINIIKHLIKLNLMKVEYSPKIIEYLNSKITFIIKEEINKIKLIIKDNHDYGNNTYYNAVSAFSFYKSELIDTKINNLMKSYYILIPSRYLDKNDSIPFSLKEDKTDNNLLKNHMVNIFLFLEILNLLNNNKIEFVNNNNLNPFEVEDDKKYIKGKTYKKEEIGKEYGFCFVGKKYDDFKNNLNNIKKSVFILTKYNFYLGEIESNTFKDLSKIKIFFEIPYRFININFPINENDSFIGIIDIRNENKNKNIDELVINCFDSENAKKFHNYLFQMISNCILFEKTIFDSFLEDLEEKLL